MRRFYVSPEDVREDELVIQGSALHHLKNVLRFKEGEEVIAFDGEGKEYSGKIGKIDNKAACIKIADEREIRDKFPVNICLCQAVIRFARMELIVEKCTELGVSRICPFVSERTTVRMDKKCAERRVDRWRKIARQASRQSGRVSFPEIAEIAAMDKFLDECAQYDKCLIPWEEEKEITLKKALKGFKQVPDSIAFFIGPEGGFTSYEVEKAKQKGAISVSLGTGLLRSETAAISVASAIMYEWGMV